MKPFIFAIIFAIGSPLAGHSEELILSAPLSGGTVHTGLVDMSVFWRPDGAAFEVVAYYVDRADAAAPRKLRMRLDEGDRVVFGLPGLPDAAYSFERRNNTVTVTAAALRNDLALN